MLLPFCMNESYRHKAAVCRFQLTLMTMIHLEALLLPRKQGSVSKQPSSSGSSATSRPPVTLWAFFTRSTAKQNKSQYSALWCMHSCWVQGQGPRRVGFHESHPQKCTHVPEALHAWARDWSKHSEPFIATLQRLEIAVLQIYRGSCLSKTWPCQSHRKRNFDILLLQGTIFGNLPFSWIDNESIQAVTWWTVL